MDQKTRDIIAENVKLLKGRQPMSEVVIGIPAAPAPAAKPKPKPGLEIPAALLPILQAADDMGKLPELLKSLASDGKPGKPAADPQMAEFARNIF